MNNYKLKNWKSKEKGAILMMTLVFTSIFLIIAGGLISLINQQQKLNRLRKAKAQALHIAEAGVNYYRWHLAHAPEDYADGTGETGCNPCGPYLHDYPEDEAIGQFELEITPPSTGSTVVTIKSTGWVTEYPDYKRIVVAKYGLPSWARYAVVANADMRFGEGTVTHGPIHSNGGIRYDGIAYNLVTSAQETYDDPDHDGEEEFGVHTHVDPIDPLPPADPPTRLDVFAGGREFPVPAVDFNAITLDLADLESAADEDGLHLNKSNRQGWHIQLLGDGTLRYRKVKSTNTCWWFDWNDWQWYSAPQGNIASYQGNWTTTDLPNNGIIFVSDNVWIDGKINGARLTIVAAKDPLASGNADIWINNDLEYTNYDGTDAIGLIAQNDINVGLYSEGDFSGSDDEQELKIDAALIAQKGRVGRYYYPEDCSSTYFKRNIITVYGSIATNQRYGFSWVCNGSWCSGYDIRNLNFDNNLTYAPPPSFPTTDVYDFISWEEVLEGESY